MNSQTPSASLDSCAEKQESELKRVLEMLQQVPQLRRHRDLLRWLQGEFQRCIPHEIMLAAWGTHPMNLRVDVVSQLPGVRTTAIQESIKPFMRELFRKWQDGGGEPLFLELPPGMAFEGGHVMRTAAVHAMRDERSQHFCIYAALGATPATGQAVARLKAFIPFLDFAFRQIPMLPEQGDVGGWAQGPFECLELSGREAEIMKWVRVGKTNHEIGLILDISAFTVKNHLQRIFRKLDVSNRAQAVARLHVEPGASRPKVTKAERTA